MKEEEAIEEFGEEDEDDAEGQYLKCMHVCVVVDHSKLEACLVICLGYEIRVAAGSISDRSLEKTSHTVASKIIIPEMLLISS